GHVEGFVQCPLTHCTITHKTNVNIIIAQVFFSKSNTSSQRNLTTNDTVSAHHFMFFGEEVHRPPFSFGTSGHFTKKLCHTFVSRHTFCQSMSMVTVRCNYRIFWPSCRDSSCHNSFLTNVKVTKSTDFLLTI